MPLRERGALLLRPLLPLGASPGDSPRKTPKSWKSIATNKISRFLTLGTKHTLSTSTAKVGFDSNLLFRCFRVFRGSLRIIQASVNL